MFDYTKWEKLVKRYKGADFNNAEQRKSFETDFTALSYEYFIQEGVDEDQLAEIWTRPEGLLEDFQKPIKEIYDNALGYLDYASDRMNYNRWLYIRLLLNCDIK